VGIPTDAVRMRISRGTLRSEKHEGRLYVLLNTDATGDVSADTSPSESCALISDLRERIASLERQLEAANERDRENRRVLAAALARISPQLEAPTQATGEPELDSRGVHEEPQESVQRPWWLFWG
jgi:hypothetical protein